MPAVPTVMDNSSIFWLFEQHLNLKWNNRIFFSWKFGSGKTYFLREYFEAHKDEFEFFHIYPVNYQISSNEDIIQFLKYDILIELLKRNEDLFEVNDYFNFTDLSRLIYLWSSDNKTEVAQALLRWADTLLGADFGIFPKLWKTAADLLPLFKKFGEFKKTIEAWDKAVVDDFIEKMNDRNISQTDYLGQLIMDKIKIQTGNNRQSILILDDLDRIDPEHVFRILNVFSAHFNDSDEWCSNKFWFDKVILVGDIHNLISFFHHKYWITADSTGYFNKFYSIEVFHLENKDLINNFAWGLIGNINSHTSLAWALEKHWYVNLFLTEILEKASLIKGRNRLNIREIIKTIRVDFPDLHKDSTFSHPRPYFNIAIRVLKTIVGGDKDRLIDIIRNMPWDIVERDQHQSFCSFFYIWIHNILNKKLEPGTKSYLWFDVTIQMSNPNKWEIIELKSLESSEDEEDPYFSFYKKLLIEYIEKDMYI